MNVYAKPATAFTTPTSRQWKSYADRYCNPNLTVDLDLAKVRENVKEIARSTGVPLLPVVKADAYGLGVVAVTDAIADLTNGFCVFQLREAIAADLAPRTCKRVLALGPPESLDPQDYLDHRVTPAVSSVQQAKALRKASPSLCVDTGMQRFACAADDVDDALDAGACGEMFTHATEMAHVARLVEISASRHLVRHAAGTALLHEQGARLDAVRPGLALYRDAVTISSPLAEVHMSKGPIGYSGFVAPRHGVILAGYSHGLRKGPCMINGERRSILEVGMQSAFVDVGCNDRVGDNVILVGAGLQPADVAASWGCGSHEVLTSLTSAATRRYRT